jgi:hypothetical protein
MEKVGDAMAVVDSRARVFNVKGLRVVDVSAFALLPPGNSAEHGLYVICTTHWSGVLRRELTSNRCPCGEDH